MNNSNVIVSICCVTYNQEKYIKACLDSFLMQKTNFKFEVLINDDCSTDGTTNIIREYEQKYPDIIKPVYQSENQYSKGIEMLSTFLFPRVKGKYIAICDGDDYWTDPYKLQKQVDFLEENQDYSLVVHKVKVIYDDNKEDSFIPDADFLKNKGFSKFDFDEILMDLYFQTSSYLLRTSAVPDLQNKIPKSIKNTDHYLLLLFSKAGKLKYFDEVMSVYRKQSSGIWYSSNYSYAKYISTRCFDLMYFFKCVYKFIAIDKEKYFKNRLYKEFMSMQFYLLSGKEFLKWLKFNYKNLYVYLLLLKHFKVMPYVIFRTFADLFRKLFKNKN